MSKNYGLKGGELEDTPRPGEILARQRAATMPKSLAEAYLWLAKHGPATREQAGAAGYGVSMPALVVDGHVSARMKYLPDLSDMYAVFSVKP